MGEPAAKQLRVSEFRQYAHRIERLQKILDSWRGRLENIESLVIDSFQAQDLDKISELLSEKKWLERRITALADYLTAQSNHGSK